MIHVAASMEHQHFTASSSALCDYHHDFKDTHNLTDQSSKSGQLSDVTKPEH